MIVRIGIYSGNPVVMDALADVTCLYVAFCRDMIIPCKQVRIYPNNKPWVTKSVKSSIQNKRLVFKQRESTYDA